MRPGINTESSGALGGWEMPRERWLLRRFCCWGAPIPASSGRSSYLVRGALAGLWNYRLLAEKVGEEIKRYGRTGTPFAVLLLDLEGLKKINDEYGHLVGSLAICRVAEVLHLSCRETDTAARYGGDEFALVLAESTAESATVVAQRVAQRLSQDAEEPRLSVSIGVAEFPSDGASLEHLLSAADHSLYRDKRRVRKSSPPSSVEK